jgi:hypothetical protein
MNSYDILRSPVSIRVPEVRVVGMPQNSSICGQVSSSWPAAYRCAESIAIIDRVIRGGGAGG